MPMFATASNDLEVKFDATNSITFKMHADLSMDLLRWMRREWKRLEMMAKRADKIEKKAIETDIDDDSTFEALTGQADAMRSKGGDEIDIIVKYIKQACLGWIDYYEDTEAQARGEVLPFEDAHIQRIGLMKLTKIANEFSRHYGLTEETDPGKGKGESLPEPSPSPTVVQLSPSGTAN